VWEKEEMPEDWKKGILCPIHKKGDILKCKNYRGISLLNTAYKVLSNIIYVRLLHYTETKGGAYQYGFHAGKSTTDNMFVLRQILEKSLGMECRSSMPFHRF
jgi:sorting nexin-29